MNEEKELDKQEDGIKAKVCIPHLLKHKGRK
jgi:hypothetical protein